MLKFLKNSLLRKKARRITQEYPPRIDTFNLHDIGTVEFANWENPLVKPTVLTNEMIGFFKQFIQEGDLAIDIGANIGDTTVPIALCTGATGLTIGFDPNPFVFKILGKNASLNPGKMKIAPVNFAISDTQEEFYFISSEASFGNGGISPTRESKHGKFIYPEKVQSVNLKNFLQENYPDWLPKLSFIKVDAEGHVKEILKSISDILVNYKPVIVAESIGTATDNAKRELFDIIHNMGYEIYYFADFSQKAAVKKLSTATDIMAWKETINIYATPLS